jgi:hypothetical protein
MTLGIAAKKVLHLARRGAVRALTRPVVSVGHGGAVPPLIVRE